MTENAHRRGKNYRAAGYQLNLIEFDQRRKYVVV